MMLASPLIAVILGAGLARLQPESLPAAAPWLVLWLIAPVVAWLVSRENSFTTASVFDLSGGRTTY